MIYRGNWKLVQEYLTYRKEVDLLSESSIRLEKTWLRHLLEWAQMTPFENVSTVRPTFPEYIVEARLDGSEDVLSPVYVRKIIRASHNFLYWLRTHKRGFSVIDQAWLDTLKTPRMTIEIKDHEIVTIEEIKAISKAQVQNLKEKRIRAAAVFWFLSGIRIGAFVTLPIKAVDLENRKIKQWPELGVKTKFKKHRTTSLLNIPELLSVVKEWDDLVRSELSEDHPWFANLSPETGELDLENAHIGNNRHHGARKDLNEWMEKMKLPYHSPHKFRHGFAVFSLKRADDIGQLKAISQNLMHSNISITDGIYGGLSETDINEQITSLTEEKLPDDKNSLKELLRLTLDRIDKLEKKLN